MSNPICLFDSGIGGLTVLKKLINKFPDENYIYLADLARVPFGDKSKEQIKLIVEEIISWLAKFNPKLIIMACNTSSTVFSSLLSTLSSQLGFPVLGMIESSAHGIAKNGYSQISVWATKLVAENNGYKNAVQKINPNIKVEEISCPKLVPMIEDLQFTIKDRNEIILEYLSKTSRDSKALILGCTHYPLLTEDIKNFTKLEIIDPTDSLLTNLETNYLKPKGISWDFLKVKKHQIALYTTAQIEKIERFARLYLHEDFKVNMISMGKVTV